MCPPHYKNLSFFREATEILQGLGRSVGESYKYVDFISPFETGRMISSQKLDKVHKEILIEANHGMSNEKRAPGCSFRVRGRARF